MAESEAVMKVEDTSAASKATEPTPSKKDGDAETENIEELEMKGLKIVENVDDIVDEPGHIKSEELIEPETIKKVKPLCDTVFVDWGRVLVVQGWIF